jgi:hypothetical protein
VQMSQKELATLAFSALFEEVKRETPNPNGTEYHLKTQLILRNSTAFPPGYSQGKSGFGTKQPKAARNFRK